MAASLDLDALDAMPQTGTFGERLAFLYEVFHAVDLWTQIHILMGLCAVLFLFCTPLVTFYELAVSSSQRVAVLGLKKRFTKYDRWLRTSSFRYIVAYKNSRGQVAEAPVKIRAVDFIDITHVTVRVRNDRIKFIDLSHLGCEIFIFTLLITVYSMILYPHLFKTDIFPTMFFSAAEVFILSTFLHMRQFVFRDRSFFLLRWWRKYFMPRKFLKTKITDEERTAFNVPDKLLTYEEAQRLQHKDVNDSLRPFVWPVIGAVIVYVAWEFLRPR